MWPFRKENRSVDHSKFWRPPVVPKTTTQTLQEAEDNRIRDIQRLNEAAGKLVTPAPETH